MKGVRQLDFGVWEVRVRLRWITSSSPAKINPSTERLPYISVECLVSPRCFRSRKIIRGYHEDSILVACFELLVKSFAYGSTFSLKEKLGDMKRVVLERILETEFFTGDDLSNQIWAISASHWHIVASPVNFITSEDSSEPPDELRFSWGSYAIYPGRWSLRLDSTQEQTPDRS